MYLISWEEGAEGPKGLQLEKDKIQNITFQMLAQTGLENNELFLLKELKTCKKINFT
jgi:hypothetical protein